MFSVTGSLAAYQQAGVYGRFRAMLNHYAQAFRWVYVCTFDIGDWTAELGLPNVTHCGMPAVPLRSQLYHFLIPFLHLRQLRRTTVVRTFNITGALPGLILRTFCGCPVFVSYGYSLPDFVRFEQGWLKYPLYRAVEWIALTGADHIICATLAQQETLGQRYGVDKVVWIPNYVDTERFRPPPAGSAQRKGYLLFVGRLDPQKNLAALLQGLAQARGQGFDLPLRIVGDGSQRRELEALARGLALPVAFEGVVPNEELPARFAGAFAFVLPSHFEGMPKALLEAMSCGLPCLGADVPGIRDLIRDSETGLLCPPTAEGVARGLLRLWQEEGLRQRLGAAARQQVLDHFSIDAVLRQEIAILQGAMRR